MSVLYAWIAVICALIVGRCQGDLKDAFTGRVKIPRYLITWGWYRWFRHPIYIFSTIMYVALVAVADPRCCWIPLVLLGPLQLYRAMKENYMLEFFFRDKYREWKRKTLI